MDSDGADMPWLDDSAWSDREAERAGGWSVTTASDRDSDDSAEVAAPHTRTQCTYTHTHTQTDRQTDTRTHARTRTFILCLSAADGRLVQRWSRAVGRASLFLCL